MKLSPDAVIATAKVAHYLLRFLDEDDKSQFLALAGYTADDPDRLIRDIREQLLPLDAELIGPTEYGTKYCIRGTLRGPNDRELRVVSIWMTVEAAGVTKFLTLYPDKP
jgi:hypothetical protein